MPLPNDVCRCRGDGHATGACPDRNACARHVQRSGRAEIAPTADHLCVYPRSAFIPVATAPEDAKAEA